MFFQCRKKYDRKVACSLPVYKWFSFLCRERTSLCIWQKGSLTLEAACVLPMFLMAMIAVLYFLQAVQTGEAVLNSLQESGKELAVYAYTLDKLESKKEGEAGALFTGAKKALSVSYVKARTTEKVKKTSAGESRILGGALGVSLASSDILEEGEMIELKANYRLKMSTPFFTLPGISVSQKAAVRAWTGKDYGEGQTDGEEGDGDTVYVTATGKVYHKDRNCTHIRLSIRQVDKDSVAGLRNEDGGKYYPCTDCKPSGEAGVYITDTGNRYHGSLGCSGLKRSVTAISKEEASGYRPCKKCGE